MPAPPLDQKLDQLYAADPDDFVALRKQLQGELRAAGNKPEAALLGRARRPSTSMWAVNQAVRRRPDLVDVLLERSEELRSAQMLGDRDVLRDAIRTHRTALTDVTEAALDVLGSRENDAFREEILSVLRAASAQPELGEELRVGRLVRSDDMTPAFPEFAGFTPEPRATPFASSRGATKARARSAPTKDDKTAADPEARAAVANTAVDAAQRRVDELNAQLADARKDLNDARSRARRARADTARRERRAM